jgi:alcohol dehydrogenase
MQDVTKAFDFLLPTEILYGPGVTARLKSLLVDDGIRKVLVVTDHGIVQAGLLEEIDFILTEAAVSYVVYDQVSPNPRDIEVEAGARMGLENGAEAVIALGGGSPIDCAKAINVLLSLRANKIKDFEGKGKVSGPLMPLYTIPTTSGTGSEVTFSSVINDTENHYKMTIKSPMMAARAALLDPALTTGYPNRLPPPQGWTHLLTPLKRILSQRQIRSAMHWRFRLPL